SHSGRHAPDRGNGYLRRAGARFRPRPRGDDGARHAHRELEPGEPVVVRPRQHARRAAGAELSRGRTARGPGAHVRGARPPRHHARRQRRRGMDHGPRVEAGRHPLSVLERTVATVPDRAHSLKRSRLERRALRSAGLTVATWTAALIASVPLFSVLYMLIVRGGSRLSWEALVDLPPAGFEVGGGFGNAIV